MKIASKNFLFRFVSVRIPEKVAVFFLLKEKKRKKRNHDDSFPNSRKPSCKIHFLGLKQDVKATRTRVIFGITEFREEREREKRRFPTSLDYFARHFLTDLSVGMNLSNPLPVYFTNQIRLKIPINSLLNF